MYGVKRRIFQCREKNCLPLSMMLNGKSANNIPCLCRADLKMRALVSIHWRREFGERSAPNSTDTSLFHGAGRFFWGRPYRSKECLKRNADGNPGAAGIPAVEQVIPVIEIRDVNVVGLVPVVSPEFRIRVNDTEPIAAILETRKPANLHKGEAVDAERMT